MVSLVAALSMLGLSLPANAAGASTVDTAAPAEDQRPPDDPDSLGTFAWEQSDTPDQPPLEPDCDEPPCEPTAIQSGGAGGYVPVSPVRVLDTGGGPGANAAIGASTAIPFQVAGFAGIPADAGAVVLNVTAEQTLRKSWLTIWPTPTADPTDPPDLTSLSTEPGRVRTGVVVSGIGAGGQISVYNHRGKVHVRIDVIGWFPSTADLTSVPPRRVLDTERGVGAPKGRLGQEPVDLPVTGIAGVPEAGVAAVVLHATSTRSSEASPVRMWPSDEFRPESRVLTTTPGHANTNLVIVAPGGTGRVSVSTDSGETHLRVEIVGWLPEGSPFRLASGVVLDTRDADVLAPGQTVSAPVLGVGGVPERGAGAEEAHSVVLALTTLDAADKTTVTAWSPDDSDQPPDIISVVGEPPADTDVQMGSTTTALARLGESGEISVRNGDAATHLLVEVVGWFANPAVAAELSVPERTSLPAEDQVVDIVVGEDDSASVVLDPTAQPVEVGESLVLGVTEATPEGYLGTVTSVETNAAGEQQLVIERALLEDVFPEGDLSFEYDADADGPTAQQSAWTWSESMTDADGGVSVSALAAPTGADADETSAELRIDWVFEDGKIGVEVLGGTYEQGDVSCDFTGLTSQLLVGLDFEFRVKWRWYKAPSVTALATLSAEASALLEKYELACGYSYPIMRVVMAFGAGPVPVVVTLNVDLEMDFWAGLNGLDLQAGAAASLTVGVRNNRGVVEGEANFEYPELAEVLNSARDLTAYAMADVWMVFSVKLYGVIGPAIGAGPFFEWFLTSNSSKPLFALDVGYAARIQLKLDLWFYKWSRTLFEGEIPVAYLLDLLGVLDKCSVYGPGLPDSTDFFPCRTPAPATRPNGDSRTMADRVRVISAGQAFQDFAPGPLRIVVPGEVPDAKVSEPYALTLGKDGWFASVSTWHWEQAQAIPGLALAEQDGALVLQGTPTAGGIFRATVQLWHGPEPAGGYDNPDDGCDEPAVGRTGCARWYGPNPPPEVELVVKVAPPGGTKTLHVDDSAPTPDGDGSDWAQAFGDLQAALDVVAADAADGQDFDYIIKVAGGTYYPGTERTDAYAMLPWAEIRGGYAGYGSAAPDERDPRAHRTVFSGDIGEPGEASDNSYHVFHNAAEVGANSTSVLDGVTITGGNADDAGSPANSVGGGMLNVDADPVLRDVVLVDNSAVRHGGGMRNFQSAPALSDVEFDGNSAGENGGGLSNENADPALMTGVVFRDNVAGVDGGGMSNDASSPIMQDVRFEQNRADGSGGGLANASSAPTLERVTFDGNTAGSSGGGVWNHQGPGSPTFINVVFVNNTAANGGAINNLQQSIVVRGGLFWNNEATAKAGAIGFDRAGTSTLVNLSIANNRAQETAAIRAYKSTFRLHNSVVWANTAPGDGRTLYAWGTDPTGTMDVQYTVGGAWPGEGNIDADPMFVDLAAGDLHALPGSHAIDSGDAQLLDLAVHTTDLDGQPRLAGEVDRGAYETQNATDLFLVDASASGSNDGSSWTNAFTRLEDALEVAGTGDTIWIAAGTYTPTAGTDRGASFGLKHGLEVYGGFAGTEPPDFELDDRDVGANATILSGDIGVPGSQSDNSFHVVSHRFGTALDGTAVLDGVTIAGGQATGSGDDANGAGMFNDTSSPTLRNVVFRNNAAAGEGGGMYLRASAPELTRVTFDGNTAGSNGGGLRNTGGPGSPTLTNVVFVNNAAANGGAINSDRQSIVVRGGVFWNNEATGKAGAIGLDRAGASTLVNVTIANNRAQETAAIRAYKCSFRLYNSVVWANTAPGDGRTLYAWGDGSSKDVRYTIGGSWPGTANDGRDPLLVDLAAGDLHLQPTSPAINTGSDALTTDLATDLDGQPRKILQVDRGADEFWLYPHAADDTATTDANVAVVIDVASNDEDPLPDGAVDPTTVTVTQEPEHGTVAVDGATGAITYTPDTDWFGVDTFFYEICNASGLCDFAAVTVTVHQVNRAPVAVDDAYVVATDGQLSTGTAPLIVGGQGTGDGEFVGPQGVASDADGNIYVVDNGNHRVQKFAADGSFLGAWGSQGSGDGEFLHPHGIAVGPDGHVYVADTLNHRVQKFTAEGGFVQAWGGPGCGDGQFTEPYGVAIDDAGELYVTDYCDRVQVFTADGTHLRGWGSPGTGIGQLQDPEGVAVAASGDVYVADTGNHRVQAFTSTGDVVTSWGSLTDPADPLPGAFFYPVAIAVDDAGAVYVASDSRVQAFSETGSFQYAVGVRPQFDIPRGVAVDATGRLVVADAQSHLVSLLDGPSGVLGNDTDPDGDALTARLVTDAGHGTLELAENGSFSYAPVAGWSGSDSFTYVANDGELDAAVATVTITVAAPPPPVYEAVTSAGGILWDDARAEAAAAVHEGCRGHLVTITSADEMQLLIDTFGSALSFKWLGGYQVEPGDGSGDPAANWTWVTGEPWAYTYWQSGEPNDDGGTAENRLLVGGSTNPAELYSWADVAADRLFGGYIIEYNCAR